MPSKNTNSKIRVKSDEASKKEKSGVKKNLKVRASVKDKKTKS